MMNKREMLKLNRVMSRCVANFKPPEDLTVDKWADKYRWLSSDSSAEAGPWRTSRTPYLKEPMESFTDPKIRRIVMVAASQVGKSEMEMNFIGYIIDQDPGSILFVQPTLEDAKKFSRLRIAPMIRDCRTLRTKVSDVRTRDSGNTILQKSFPGGMLTITGSNSASALASTPARYIIGDERDRWAVSAGTEGDPWALAKARQATFYNAKAVEVSTPTIRGASNIEDSFYQGTQERWCSQCPECGGYSEITFDKIQFQHHIAKVCGKDVYTVDDDIFWACPECGCMIPEHVVRKQPAKWIAENPDAYEQGVRSFWLNAFSSPWTPWKKIALEFLQAHDDPQKLQVVYNTLFGQLWENRPGMVDEDTLMGRREYYGTNEDGTPVELPDGVIVLTCGMDTQDNRLEVKEPGPRYCHFPREESYGYDSYFYNGLLSEHLELVKTKTGKKWAWKSFRMRREWLTNDFCMPAYEIWMSEAVARGRITAPGFFTDPVIRAAYLGCEWIGPSQGQLDPVKEITAEILSCSEGFSTHEQSTIRLNGGQWDANIERLQRENEKLGGQAPDPHQEGQQEAGDAGEGSSPHNPENAGRMASQAIRQLILMEQLKHCSGGESDEKS